MEGGAEVAATKAEPEVAGPVAPVSIFSLPRRWAGNPPPRPLFICHFTRFFELSDTKEMGENISKQLTEFSAAEQPESVPD